MSDFDKEYVSAKDAIDLLRLQKHDFLNYIQMISGYLQLGDVKKSQTYVQKALDELNRSGSITRIANPALSINLLLRVYKAFQNHGVVIDFDADTDLKFFVHDSRAAELFDRIFSVIEEVYKGEEEPKLQIVFREIKKAYWMQVSVLSSESNAMTRLRERLEEAVVDLDRHVCINNAEVYVEQTAVCVTESVVRETESEVCVTEAEDCREESMEGESNCIYVCLAKNIRSG